MDSILDFSDKNFFTPFLYSKQWKTDSPSRQFISLYIISVTSAYFLYFFFCSLSYIFLFDKRLLTHPLILKNQIKKEIYVSCTSIPIMGVLETVCFWLEIRGYSKLYSNMDHESKYGLFFVLLNIIPFVLFTDFCIYWIHRGLHNKSIYKHFHKTHHLWKVPTPYAAYAFHPLDGFVQSLPYHLYVFLFPMYSWLHLALFTFVNFWTVSIHDGNYAVPNILKSLVNGSAHHTDHHLFYNFNYGQFFTIWDRIGGSFREPSAYLGNSPIDNLNNASLNQEKKIT